MEKKEEIFIRTGEGMEILRRDRGRRTGEERKKR